MSILTQNTLIEICKNLTYFKALGHDNLSGELWEKVFAKSLNGKVLNSSNDIIDVVVNDCAFSLKTIKLKNPFESNKIRIISGRNNIVYSYNIENPFLDIQDTGTKVLNIYNKRIKEALTKYRVVKKSILIRSSELDNYIYFEDNIKSYNTKNYYWKKNKNSNLEGYCRKTKEHKFTWQSNGSQFTIIYNVPNKNKRNDFTLKNPKLLDFNSIIELIGFNENWLNEKKEQ